MKILLTFLLLTVSAAAQTTGQYLFQRVDANRFVNQFVTPQEGLYLRWVGGQIVAGSPSGSGTVTSVALTAPTGFTVGGSPVTGSGTLTFAYAAGFQAFTNAQASLIASALQPGALIPWGDVSGKPAFGTMALETATNYLTTAAAATTYQPLDAQLTDLAGLSYAGNSLKVVRVNAGGTGFELATITSGGASPAGSGSELQYRVDGSTFGAVTGSSVSGGNITLGSGTITASNLSGTNTGDQTITLSGDVTGSGTGAITATLANTAVTAGSYTSANITVDAKGRITAAANGSGGSLPANPLGTSILSNDGSGAAWLSYGPFTTDPGSVAVWDTDLSYSNDLIGIRFPSKQTGMDVPALAFLYAPDDLVETFAATGEVPIRLPSTSGTLLLTNGNGSALTSLNASNLSSGTVGTARLGSGTADSTTFLRGDGTWATPAGAGTVTSVGGTGTVNGLTLTGTVTTTGNLTLGGTLSGVDLATAVTGTLPVNHGGTGYTSIHAAITAATSKTTLAGTEEVWINDAGATKKTTAQDIANLGGGGAPAAIETVKTDAFSTTSMNGTWADVTDLSVTITPSSAAKKVKVEVGLSVATSANPSSVGFRIVRGSTPVQVGDVTGLRTAVTGQINTSSAFYCVTSSFALIDAPATTSATTYKVQICGLNGSAHTTYVNRTNSNDDQAYTGNGVSYIRVQEVD